MRFLSLLGPAAAEIALLIQLWPLLSIPVTRGANFDPVPTPGLDLRQLGRVALTGDFDAISLYTYKQQTENSFNTNGSQSLITQLPNGDFMTAASADAYIKSMCPFVMNSGQLAGVVVGGNFTSLEGVQAQGVAMFDPTKSKVSPLTGLVGQVSVLLCDQETNTVYVGGEFKGLTSTNAIAWVGTQGWTELPFSGFNGPVRSIVKEPNGNIVFGGSFSGIGNSTVPIGNKTDQQQIINISNAKITAGSSTSTAGFGNPGNILCKFNGQDGVNNTWLLQDNSPGFWRADMNFGYRPNKLRIWNTHQDGRGTKTFRYTAMPINGIMNFTYTDPATHQTAYCDARCPLSNDPSLPYQDFTFFNDVGMNGFRIDISDWYGSGGGLDGVELFQNEIFAYAVDALDEPSCAVPIPFASNATATGPWSRTPSGQSNSEYLTADLSGSNITAQGATVIFMPDIKQSGNYSVIIFTPGCIQDNSCDRRGVANVTGTLASAAPPFQTPISQTNNFDKYDQIYYGPVDANSDTFRPTVTLTPQLGQQSEIKLVAQSIRFDLTNSTGGLNGLYEFNPNPGSGNNDFSNSTIDQAGMSLNPGATINSVAVLNSATYVAGNLSDKNSGFQNIFSVTNGNATSLPNGGLNSAVSALYAFEDLLFVGGNFTNTAKDSVSGLNNVALYHTSNQSWSALGAGVNGRVSTIVPLELNVTSSQPEMCVTVNGDFDQVLASGSGASFSAQGFAIWVPSRNIWLQSLNAHSMAVSGKLTASTNVTGMPPILAGTLSTQAMQIRDAVSLTSNPLSINSFGVNIQPQQVGNSTKRKRAVSGKNVTGVVTGLFYDNNGQNITILGGHFTAKATNGSTINNLAFINSTSNTVTGVAGSGLDPSSVFLSLNTHDNILYAGGTLSGQVNGANVNGLILYDLVQADYAYPQPPAFGGSDVAVNAIAVRPGSSQVYAGGNFNTAGTTACPSVCVFENGMWSQPGSGLGGSVAAFAWQGNDKLLAGGNLTVGNNATSLANYDAKQKVWTAVAGVVPGPVTALSPANNDASQFWVAGKSTNGSAFLMKYDGSHFLTVGDDLGKDTVVRGLSVLQLTTQHESNPLVDQGMTLLVTGQLELPAFGNVSAALFNGTTFSPFILSTSGTNPGSLSQLFSEKVFNFKSSGGHMALGLVVLIALACALGAIFLLVVAGILIERYRRKAEGYTPVSTSYFDKTSNMGRIPPEHLFGSLGQVRRGDAPML